ncbi:hypothetical protein ACFVRD_41525 [Streptomyces sp. NPDC057908]|uniref:hypothetical protein n=1 Tax=Streptomyces sp. NPDC057908 TaxID=3346276 RepID=UPI0036E38616
MQREVAVVAVDALDVERPRKRDARLHAAPAGTQADERRLLPAVIHRLDDKDGADLRCDAHEATLGESLPQRSLVSRQRLAPHSEIPHDRTPIRPQIRRCSHRFGAAVEHGNSADIAVREHCRIRVKITTKWELSLQSARTRPAQATFVRTANGQEQTN